MSATTGWAALVANGFPREESGEMHFFRIWHLPIRITHWVASTAILVLIVTGLYIGDPFVGTTGEASGHFLMGWMRFLHFFAAAVLVPMALLRVYWLFNGNRYERWHALFPVRRRDLRNLGRTFWAYLTVRPARAPRYLGHNPLQQLSYTIFYAVAVVEVLTGLAQYGLSNTGGLMYTLFSWVVVVLGGWQRVRLLHHALAWVFVLFIPIHVYLVIRNTMLDQDGGLLAIFTGTRLVRGSAEFEDA